MDPILKWTLIIVGSWLVGFFVFMCVAVALPVGIARDSEAPRPLWMILLGNLIGWPLIIVGIVLLPTPMNGIVLVFVGVAIADFPKKRELRAWLMRKDRVRNGLNRIRKRVGRRPILDPQ